MLIAARFSGPGSAKSARVGNVRNNDSSLIEPVAAA